MCNYLDEDKFHILKKSGQLVNGESPFTILSFVSENKPKGRCNAKVYNDPIHPDCGYPGNSIYAYLRSGKDQR